MLSTREKIDAAIALKDEGNGMIKRGEVKACIGKYRTVFAYVNGLTGASDSMARYSTSHISDEEEEEVKKLKVSVYSNLALAYLKLERWEKAIEAGEDAIKIGPEESCVKAYCRMGQAQLELKQYDAAKASLMKAAKLSPKDKTIRVQLQKWKEAYKVYSEDQLSKQKEIFGGKF
mmetsp:Transcript_19176/g.31436  ORF Transcript_19176/g.31436 Transcript_19176/m.31436 type:complete len:175 (-) Transcript_19176:888-1412(-)